jgi:hypothetical protein
MKRFANQQQCDFVFPYQRRQRAEVVTDSDALKCLKALRTDSKRIANRQPDSFFAHIESKNPTRQRLRNKIWQSKL